MLSVSSQFRKALVASTALVGVTIVGSLTLLAPAHAAGGQGGAPTFGSGGPGGTGGADSVGGAGVDGGPGGSAAGFGGGGGGGAGATGGAGGAGGNGGAGVAGGAVAGAPGQPGNSGLFDASGGGGGAHGAVLTGGTTIGAATSGGAGGAGGTPTLGTGGGGGGGGGYGIATTGAAVTVTVNAAVAGGAGGAGGDGTGPGEGGNGGTGGIGAFMGAGNTLVNNSSITGGAGGAGGIGSAFGTAGAGGAGVVGSNLSITNAGTIVGTGGADAITFTAGANALTFGNATSGLTGAIGNNGTSLTFAQNNGVNTTIANAITGAGSVIKTGADSVTLSVANSYSGGTVVQAGTLAITGAGTLGAAAGSVSVSGGVLDLGATTQTQNGGVTLTGGTIQNGTLSSSGTFALQAGTVNATLAGSGSLTKTSLGTVTLSQANTYTGTTTISGGTVVMNHVNGGNNVDVFGTPGGATVVTLSGATLRATINNSATLYSFSSPTVGAISSISAAAGVNFFLNAGGGSAVSNVGGLSFGTATDTGVITYAVDSSSGAGQVFVSGGTLRDGNGSLLSLLSGAFATQVKSGTTLDLATFGNSSGNSINFLGNYPDGSAGTVTWTTNPLQIAAGTFSGLLAGSGGLTKTGTGTLTLSNAAANTFTGGVNLNGGILSIAADNNLGAAANALTFAGGTLQATATIASARAATLNAGGGTFDVTGANILTLSGIIAGAAGNALTKSGTGTLVLGNAGNTYAGGTVINGGTVSIADNGALGDVAGGITFGATGGTLSNTAAVTSARAVTLNGPAVFETAATLLQNGAITGAGSLQKTGASSLVLTSDANAWTGGTTITAGTLQVGNGGATGVLPGDVADNAALAFNRTAALTVAGIVSGTGTLTQSGAGVITLTGANTYAGGTTIGAGTTLQIGAGGTAGSIVGNVTDNGTLTFNRSDAIAFAGAITGGGALVKNGGAGSSLNLTGGSTYTGATSVNSGTLFVNGSLGATAVAVASGATLGGSGTIGGPVTIANGGILAPGNSPGTLTVASLALNPTSQVNYELGTANVAGGATNDLTTVTGNVTLDGVLNVADSGGFGLGAYRIFNYGGALTNNTLDIGTIPNGSAAFASIQTAIPGQVNLVVAGPGTPVQFWDGADTVGNGVVNGGTGTWTNANTNWTQGSAGVNSNWLGGFAVFAANPGTVTVADAISYQGIQFTADGYLLVPGAGGTLSPVGQAPIRVDQGVTATIAAPIVGTGGINKTDPGTLVLSGANTYTGATTVSAGTLAVGAGGQINGSSSIVNNATFTVAGAGSVNVGSITNNGTFSAAGSVTAGGSFANNGTLTASSIATPTFVNSGTVNGLLGLTNLSVLTNNPGAVINDGVSIVAAGGGATVNNAGTIGTGGLVIANAGGTLTANNTSGKTFFGFVNSAAGTTTTFNNTASGVWNYQGASTLAGNDTINNFGAFNVTAAGGALNGLEVFTNAGSLALAGNLGGTIATLTNTGQIALNGRILNGVGTLNNNAGGLIAMSSGTLAATTINNNATSTIQAVGTINATTLNNAGFVNLQGNVGGAIGNFRNNAGGILDLTTNSAFGNIGTFDNASVVGAPVGTSRATSLSGTLGVATFNNLPTGVINLAGNGSTTDVLALTGNYAGSAGSRLMVDVNLTAASGVRSDVLQIGGTNTGVTTLDVNRVGNGRAIFFAQPIPVVTAAGGAGQVNLSQPIPRNGLVSYELQQSTPGSYQIVSRIDATAAASASSSISSLTTALNVGFFQSVSAFIGGAPQGGGCSEAQKSTGLCADQTASVSVGTSTKTWAQLNTLSAQSPVVAAPVNGITPNTWSGGVWVRASGGETTIRNTNTATFPGATVSSAGQVHVNFGGSQVGIDSALFNIDNTGWNVHLGITGGEVLASGIQRLGSITTGDFTVPFIGVYGALTSGPFFSDLSYRHDFFNAKITDSLAGLSQQRLNIGSDTVGGSAGYRFDFEGLFGTALPYFVEPSASMSYTHTTIGGIPISAGALSFRPIDSILGRLGFRVGTAYTVNDRIAVSPFITASVWNEFGANALTRFTPFAANGQLDPNSSVPILTNRVGTFGQVGVGISGQIIDTPILGFVRGDVRFGDRLEGYAVTGGLRYQF